MLSKVRGHENPQTKHCLYKRQWRQSEMIVKFPAKRTMLHVIVLHQKWMIEACIKQMYMGLRAPAPSHITPEQVSSSMSHTVGDSSEDGANFEVQNKQNNNMHCSELPLMERWAIGLIDVEKGVHCHTLVVYNSNPYNGLLRESWFSLWFSLASIMFYSADHNVALTLTISASKISLLAQFPESTFFIRWLWSTKGR